MCWGLDWKNLVVADPGKEFENSEEFISYQDIRKVFDEENISKIRFVMSDLDKNVIGDTIISPQPSIIHS